MAIPWIPLITTGLSLLGGALGKTESQSSSEVSDSIITGSTKQDQNLNSSTTQSQSGTSTQTSNDTAVGKTSESVNRLDNTTKNMLTQAVQGLLGKAGGGAVDAEIAKLTNPATAFDADGFVNGIMASAKANAGDAFGSGVNNIRSRIGANSGTNSMAALLEERLSRDTQANLAGIESQARLQAEGIGAQRIGSLTSLVGTQQNEIQGLLTSLMNATQTSSGDSTTTNTGTTTGATTNTGTETTTQKQSTVGNTGQTQSTKTNAAGSGSSQDWTKTLEGFAKAFSTTF